MSDATYDSVVVGAGPAGASAARVLGEAGQSVLLLDIASFPRRKPCGGLMADAARPLLGARGEAAIQRCFDRMLVRLRPGLPDAIQERVVLVDRQPFDHAVLLDAQEAGAEFRVISGIDSIEGGADRVVLTTRDRQSFSARYLIGCDGSSSGVARGLRVSRSGPKAAALVAEVPLECCLPELATRPPLFDFLAIEDGYAWTFPKRDHLNVGVYSVKPGPALKDALGAFARREGVGAISTFTVAVIPTVPVAPPSQARSVLLAGDAAGLADRFTGGGLHSALLSGRLAARAVLEAEDAGAGALYDRLLEPLRERLERQRALADLVFRTVPTDRSLPELIRQSAGDEPIRNQPEETDSR
jgi:geranylgeranyl reductase family protein